MITDKVRTTAVLRTPVKTPAWIKSTPPPEPPRPPVTPPPVDPTGTGGKREGGTYRDLGDKQNTFSIGDANFAYSTPAWYPRLEQNIQKAAPYVGRAGAMLMPGYGPASTAFNAAGALTKNTDWESNPILAKVKMPAWGGDIASLTLPEKMSVGPLSMTRPNTTTYSIPSPFNGQNVKITNPLYEPRPSERANGTIVAPTGTFINANGYVVRGNQDSTKAITLDQANKGVDGGAVWLNNNIPPVSTQDTVTPIKPAYDFMADYNKQIAARMADSAPYLNYIQRYKTSTDSSGGGGGGGGGGGFGTNYGWGGGGGYSNGYQSAWAPEMGLFQWNYRG